MATCLLAEEAKSLVNDHLDVALITANGPKFGRMYANGAPSSGRGVPVWADVHRCRNKDKHNDKGKCQDE